MLEFRLTLPISLPKGKVTEFHYQPTRMAKERINIGITIGDFNGIGPELIIKTLADHAMNKFFTPVVYGSSRILSYYKKTLNVPDFNYLSIREVSRADARQVNVINCWTEEAQITMGKPAAQAGALAVKALEKATQDALDGKIQAVVTAPVNKAVIRESLPEFTGQTEFLAEKAGVTENLMLLASENLRIALVTNHLPIKDVAGKITSERLARKLELLESALRQDFLIDKPKIAVLALNPHAGENGHMGKEEEKVIKPVIRELSERMLVFGPYPADGFFGSRNTDSFDAILAMYHDQGLTPFKALTFGQGVNITGGLPFIRTSPDHGTAYDIAGQNRADCQSFRQALFTAYDLYRNRQEYTLLHSNPLQKTELAAGED